MVIIMSPEMEKYKRDYRFVQSLLAVSNWERERESEREREREGEGEGESGLKHFHQ